MPENFYVPGFCTAGTNKTAVNVYQGAATPTARAKITDIAIGSYATPADQYVRWIGGRSSANGTGTAFTPNNLDNIGPAGQCAAAINHSGEPTYTSNKQLLDIPVNQRATFRWNFAPGQELIIPATQNAGIGFYSLTSSGTPTCTVSVWFTE